MSNIVDKDRGDGNDDDDDVGIVEKSLMWKKVASVNASRQGHWEGEENSASLMENSSLLECSLAFAHKGTTRSTGPSSSIARSTSTNDREELPMKLGQLPLPPMEKLQSAVDRTAAALDFMLQHSTLLRKQDLEADYQYFGPLDQDPKGENGSGTGDEGDHGAEVQAMDVERVSVDSNSVSEVNATAAHRDEDEDAYVPQKDDVLLMGSYNKKNVRSANKAFDSIAFQVARRIG